MYVHISFCVLVKYVYITCVDRFWDVWGQLILDSRVGLVLLGHPFKNSSCHILARQFLWRKHR